jgi:hypothetical protein
MSGGGGDGGAISKVAGMTPQAPAGSAGVGYTNPRDSVGPPYQPSYTPQTATPFLQSIMEQQRNSSLQQGNSLGLPSLQSMFNMPQRGAPYQPSGLQQLAPMAPYVGSTYRPDMSGIMARLNSAAPAVRPEQVSELDNQGKPVLQESVVSDTGYGGGGGA